MSHSTTTFDVDRCNMTSIAGIPDHAVRGDTPLLDDKETKDEATDTTETQAAAGSDSMTNTNLRRRRPRILLGVTGSVAAIKAPEIAARLAMQIQADVKILLTRGGENFWRKAQAYNPVVWERMQAMLTDNNDNDDNRYQQDSAGRISVHYAQDEWKEWQHIGDAVLHIDLRNWADLLLVAPLSAHTLAKLAHGLCDDTLSCVVRAWDFGYNTGHRQHKPVLMAPAMNTAMWDHPLTQSQMTTVCGFWNDKQRVGIRNGTADLEGVRVIAPQIKTLACGELGNGALASVDEIVRIVELYTKIASPSFLASCSPHAKEHKTLQQQASKMKQWAKLLPWEQFYVDNDGKTKDERKPECQHNESNYIRNRKQLVKTILSFRMLYLFAMMLSCHLIPEHNPGDDVLRFPLRLENNGCFCRHGHACASLVTDVFGGQNVPKYCAIPSQGNYSGLTIATWSFILSPFTKWDSARFLSLAVQPTLRDPSFALSNPFETSEQAHAFLPMFPWLLRTTAVALYQILPSTIMPPSFEALAVLCGILFNNIVCLTISTLALYELTIQVLTAWAERRMQSLPQSHHCLAVAVSLIFGIWNPASVFFATNYSESFFFATTLLGFVCLGESWQLDSGRWIQSCIWWSCGIICWMIGSYTRANGTINALWLLQIGCAQIFHSLRLQPLSRRRKAQRLMCTIFYTLMSATLVVLPTKYHDWSGYQRHCQNESSTIPQPLWCFESSQDSSGAVLVPSFSLYRYVQDEHWNVGFFRYYQWKQLPNFLLAAPILALSFGGAYVWIQWSLVTEFGKGKLPSSLELVASWPFFALSESILQSRVDKPSGPESLVQNPCLLGFYAILTVLALVGLVIAHVQISTRLICSTSPAIYWFMGYIILTPRHVFARKLVWSYAILYMILGIVLHVNFLPWT